MTQLPRVAVLDDYQGVALEFGDWDSLAGRAEVTVFRDHLTDHEALVRRLRPFDVLCIMRERTPIDRALVERLPNLKLVATTGYRNAAVDLAALEERGILMCGTPGSSHTTAELTWALVLALSRHLFREVESVRAGGWQLAVGTALRGSTLGVVGLGTIGTLVAGIGRAFGMKVIAWSSNLDDARATAAGATRVDKDTLFREADVVTLHLKLSGRSAGTVGARELALMKPTALLVNTSRGPLVDEAALIDALRERRIAGAGLDTFDVEPLPSEHPYRRLPNVVATPHIGYVTASTYRDFYGTTVANLRAWLDGKPINLVTST